VTTSKAAAFGTVGCAFEKKQRNIMKCTIKLQKFILFVPFFILQITDGLKIGLNEMRNTRRAGAFPIIL